MVVCKKYGIAAEGNRQNDASGFWNSHGHEITLNMVTPDAEISAVRCVLWLNVTDKWTEGVRMYNAKRCLLSGEPQSPHKQGNHAIAMMTARCAQYVSTLKIVSLCKRKNSRRLRKNLHITILSLFCGEIIFEVFHPM